MLGLGACRNEPTSGEVTSEEGLAVDPQNIANRTVGSKLSAEERDLLARARGREWQSLSVAQVEAFFTPPNDSLRAAFLWDPASGAAALMEAQSAMQGLDNVGISTAIFVADSGDAREQLIDLRESQAVLAAFRIPAQGSYGFLPGGTLPLPGSLIVSGQDGGQVVVFPPGTPIASYAPLLNSLRPR